MKSKNIVILFCYNVENNIIDVCNKLLSNNIASYSDILFIEDSSTDNTYELIKNFSQKLKNVFILKNENNCGYGKNYKISIKYVLEKKYEKLIFLHGDGQYPVDKIKEMLDELDENDLCYGSRFLNTDSVYENMPKIRIIANRILTLLINILIKNNASEYFSGFRGFKTKLFKDLNLTKFKNSWIIEQEIHLWCLLKNKKIKEFPIKTVYEDRISRVPPFRYVKDVIICTIKFFLIRKKILNF